jgi:hypothetical protein
MIPILISGVLCFLLGTETADSVLKKEVAASPGQRLTVELKTGGSAHIAGWEKDLVSVEAIADEEKENSLRLEVQSVPGGVSVKASGNRSGGNLRFEIRTPRKFNVDFKSMGGSLNLSGLEGTLSGETKGGNLTFEGIKGDLSFKTMGGNLWVKNSEANGSIETMGGNITVENVLGNVNGTSMGGNVSYKNVRLPETQSAGEVLKIKTMGGEINVEQAGSGVSVTTMGGGIHIKSAHNLVNATTMGGDIALDAIDGAIKCKTMGGNVAASIVGVPNASNRDVDISSMRGEISLTVPEGFSANLDITLNYTRNSRQNYKITSDFPIQVKESDQWEYSSGSPRKTIQGTGIIGAGANRIKISTINGNIAIKKAK